MKSSRKCEAASTKKKTLNSAVSHSIEMKLREHTDDYKKENFEEIGNKMDQQKMTNYNTSQISPLRSVEHDENSISLNNQDTTTAVKSIDRLHYLTTRRY